jgi:hypothetical protein
VERFHGHHKTDKGTVGGYVLEAWLAAADKGCRRVQLQDGMAECPPRVRRRSCRLTISAMIPGGRGSEDTDPVD